jgi:hypothetical protein
LFDCIDKKFKTFRIRFIFDFKIVFIKTFLKMAPTRVHQDFLQEQDYPREHVFREFSGAPAGMRTTLEQSHFTYADLFRAGLPGGVFFRGFVGALAVIRHTLEQIPLREILLQDKIPGYSTHGLPPFFKSSL